MSDADLRKLERSHDDLALERARVLKQRVCGHEDHEWLDDITVVCHDCGYFEVQT